MDYLAVVEHRFIPARVRSEWTGLRAKGSSHVGNAGVNLDVRTMGSPTL